MEKIIQNAIARSYHFSHAIAWFEKKLKQDSLFQKQFESLSTELSKCVAKGKGTKNVFFIAVGKSAQIAQLTTSMLASVGVCTRFIHATEAFHGDLGFIGKHDVVVLISNNGASNEILQLLPILKTRQVKIYALTSKETSPLAKSADHTLPIPAVSEMCPVSQAPLTSTLTTLALCQLLVAATMELRRFPLEEYAQNHPGGAIGKRIFLKVEDLMHQGEHLPTIKKSALFQEIISTFTRFSKAALLVVEKKKLLGLITEKDLRKSMEKYGEKAFKLKAQDLMNLKPTTIQPEVLAVDAMQMMTEKNPPFNLLPVVDKKGSAVGLIHIHDLIAAGITIPS